MQAEDKSYSEDGEPIIVGGIEPEADDKNDDVVEPDAVEEESESDEVVAPEAPPKVDTILENEDIKFLTEDLAENREILKFDLELAKKGDKKAIQGFGLEHYPLTDATNGSPINIYNLSEDEFDVLVERMQNTEGFSKQLLRKIITSKAKYDAKLEAYEANHLQQIQNTHTQEWRLILEQGPAIIRENENKITAWMKEKLATDLAAQRRVDTFKGKLYLVERALKELQLSNAKVDVVKKPLPAMHQVQASGSGKKATATPDLSAKAIKDMTVEEYAKYRNSIHKKVFK